MFGNNESLNLGGLAADSVTILSNTDYYPFGMEMPGRKGNTGDYRYGFNGHEKDDEVKGEGNSLDFGARIYDPRLGRFLSVDPMAREMVSISDYCYAANSPIAFIDADGLGPILVVASLQQSKNVEAALKKGDHKEVQRILYYAATHDYVDNDGKPSSYLRDKIKEEHGEDVPEGGSLMNIGNAEEGVTKIYGIRETEDGNTEAYLIGETKLDVFNEEVDNGIDYQGLTPKEAFDDAFDANIDLIDDSLDPLNEEVERNELGIEIHTKQRFDNGSDPAAGPRGGVVTRGIIVEQKNKKPKRKVAKLEKDKANITNLKNKQGEK